MRCRSGLLRFLAYACVGATGTGIQYAVLFVLVSMGVLGAVAASCLGAIAGAVVNYLLNYRFTFKSTALHRKIAPRFFAIATAGVVVNSLCMFLLVHALRTPWLSAQCLTTLCVLATTYTANALWTFRAQRI